MSRSCPDLDVQVNAERLCEYLRTERPVLLVGSPKCDVSMDLQSLNRRDQKFQKTLEAGLISITVKVSRDAGFCILITAGVRAPRRCEPWNLCLELE